MNKVFYVLIAIAALFSSCANSYSIQGSSDLSTLDGRKLYLEVPDKDFESKNLDSCDVVHGQFAFSGSVDTVMLASIAISEGVAMPLILESGDIVVKINNTQRDVSGTPMNDKLYQFLKNYDQLISEQYELVHKHDQAIMDGSDMEEVVRRLNAQGQQISTRLDKLVTNFVTENFDNILGPGVFMMVTTNPGTPPMLSPWIEDIMSKATDKFKNDPYVKEYYSTALRNQDILNGMTEAPVSPAPPAPGTVSGAAPAPPTPAEMAGDSLSSR